MLSCSQKRRDDDGGTWILENSLFIATIIGAKYDVRGVKPDTLTSRVL
jgi:hypothetical protein